MQGARIISTKKPGPALIHGDGYKQQMYSDVTTHGTHFFDRRGIEGAGTDDGASSGGGSMPGLDISLSRRYGSGLESIQASPRDNGDQRIEDEASRAHVEGRRHGGGLVKSLVGGINNG